MRDQDKTKAELITELAKLRRLAGLAAPSSPNPALNAANLEELAQIERAKHEWEATVDSLPELICLFDAEGCIVRANLTLERWGLGEVRTIRGESIRSLFSTDLADFWVEAWAALDQGQSATCEIRDKSLNRYLRFKVQPIQITEKHRRALSSAVLIVEDITARQQAEEALRQYALALEARNEELDAFAHTVAHDLQNQAVLVIGFAEVLNRYHGTMPPDELLDTTSKIVQNGQKMSNIIKELLLLASVRQTEVEPGPLDMAGILVEARKRLAYIIEDTGGEILYPEAWPLAIGYAPWIEEVWVNYLSNGLKYGGKPPRLELGATPQADGMIRFWIRDNGPGLSPEAQVRLFTPFTRLSQVRAMGHGLGLSIVRRIVEKLGGQVGVESEGQPGRGCTFSFTLPAVTG